MKSALLIGLNYSNTPYQLNGCLHDVTNMRSLLVSNGYSHITTLIDSDPKRIPTKQRILQELKNVVSSKSSELFIFYSGHGSRVKDMNQDEQNGMDSVIVPSDFKTNGFIIDDELLSIIKNITCKCTLLFDSCNSGTVCDLQWSFQYQNKDTYVRSQNNVFSIANPNIFMFSGCRDSQFSADSYSLEEQEPVGAFTNALIQVLRAKRHNVQIVLLYRDVCNYLTSGGFGQNPVFSSSAPVPNYRFIRASPPL